MTSSGDFNVRNFQSLIENYEAALRDVTGELDTVQAEQRTIKKAISENNHLSTELHKVLTEKVKCEVETKFQESDLIENLKFQLKIISNEKEQAVKLWQNAANAVEQLENEVKLYQESSHELIPKSKLFELKNSYEEKLNDLQATVTKTKIKLEETINLKSKVLISKDQESTAAFQTHDKSVKIIKNLEEEVSHLQKRLDDVNEEKSQLEKDINSKNEERASLKRKVKESRSKVEEALQVVEAAICEKDAALLREAQAKEESATLSQTLTEFVDQTNAKITSIQNDHQTKIEQMKEALEANQNLIKIKDTEIENYTQKFALLEMEIQKFQSTHFDEGTASKMLLLEKNLENTFQKLLLSEKQNIQLKAEMEDLKTDLDLMSHFYERDINSREAEKAALKNEINKLKMDLDASLHKISQSTDQVTNLNKKISSMEVSFQEQMKETKNAFQQTCFERQERETVHSQIVIELQEQLISQTQINKKWRAETKNITGQLEKIIIELKNTNYKIKQENKQLNERLKEANLKMFEYRKFLEMISSDVTKITTVTLPEMEEGAT